MSTSQYHVILAQFPDCLLAPLEGLTNYAYLTEFNSYLNTCTSDISTNGGCGTLGYLIVMAPPATFLLLWNDQIIVPTNPGPSFQIPTGPVTASVLSEFKTKYIEELRLCKEYYNIDKSVKAKIQQSRSISRCDFHFHSYVLIIYFLLYWILELIVFNSLVRKGYIRKVTSC